MYIYGVRSHLRRRQWWRRLRLRRWPGDDGGGGDYGGDGCDGRGVIGDPGRLRAVTTGRTIARRCCTRPRPSRRPWPRRPRPSRRWPRRRRRRRTACLRPRLRRRPQRPQPRRPGRAAPVWRPPRSPWRTAAAWSSAPWPAPYVCARVGRRSCGARTAGKPGGRARSESGLCVILLCCTRAKFAWPREFVHERRKQQLVSRRCLPRAQVCRLYSSSYASAGCAYGGDVRTTPSRITFVDNKILCSSSSSSVWCERRVENKMMKEKVTRTRARRGWQ